MKKFFRNLFSGYFLILLILLAELGIFVFVQFFLDDVISNFVTNENGASENVRLLIGLIYFLIRAIIFVVGIIIFFKIVNKAEDPEFKIPWIVGMLLLPFFTAMVYLIFGNHGLSKRDRLIIDATRSAYNSHFKLNEETRDKYKDELGHAVGTFKYINSTTQLGIHTNNRVTYYKCGEEFFPALLEGLKQAKEFIFIEFFIITDGKEWSAVQEILEQKAKEGVNVRILYDDMGCSGTISPRTP